MGDNPIMRILGVIFIMGMFLCGMVQGQNTGVAGAPFRIGRPLQAGSFSDTIRTALGDTVPVVTRRVVGDSIYTIVARALGDSLRDAIGDSLRVALGDSVRAALGDSIETVIARVAVVSGTGATATGTVVEDGVTGVGTVVSAISSGTANTFGSWVQLDASLSADSWICNVNVVVTSAPGVCVLEIGKGASASEVTIIRVSYYAGVAYQSFSFTIPVPIKVASGTRLAARASDQQADARTHVTSVQYYQGLE